MNTTLPVPTNTERKTSIVLGCNAPPKLFNLPYRIAIIGEAYGRDEAAQGQPFVGMSGRFLSTLLSKAGIIRDACFVGNVCPVQPLSNNLANFSWFGEEIQGGIDKLTKELKEFSPLLVVCLGNTALHLFKEGNTPPRFVKGRQGPAFIFPNSVDSWRGSLFTAHANSPLPGVKCIASYHPAACLRQYSWTPILLFDLLKARREGEVATLTLPQRELIIKHSIADILAHTDAIQKDRCLISCDIEGGLKSLSCISIATSATRSFIIPIRHADGTPYWATLDEEVSAWQCISRLMTDPKVPKIFQNGLYDCFVLQYGYGIPVLGVVEDTMLKFWEKFCELEKSLAFQCSILTDEPFYKYERKANDTETFFRYCCRDSATTFELAEKLNGFLSPDSMKHYRFNVDLLAPILYMELRGIRYAESLAEQRLGDVNYRVYEWQQQLDKIAGLGVSKDVSSATLLAQVQSVCCHKRDPSKVKKDYVNDWAKILRLVYKPRPLTDADVGFLNTVLDCGMNIKSARFKDYLYEDLGLPPQYDPKSKALTTDFEALLKLSKLTQHPAVTTAMELGFLRTRAQMLAISADKDGRVRCGYNVVGTETGRITCYTSPTGSGYNLQTIPSDDHLKPPTHPLHHGMRDLFLPDEGCFFFQCDLSGADGWTVGAHLHSLGDPTMLDDLRSKLKPAAIICYLLRHGSQSLAGKERDEIKVLLKEVKKEDWDYFACKQGIWGTCYLMGPDKLADTILTQSEGKVALSRSQVRDFQAAVFHRYRVQVWHRVTSSKLFQKPEMTSASGQTRHFFGRKEEILGEALANEPQQNTTYATNLALHKLWNDPDNRIAMDHPFIPGPTNLRIEPLHQVHDALCGQFRKEDTAWAVDKIKSYFANTLKIAGLDIVIPFEGQYGTSWGKLEHTI